MPLSYKTEEEISLLKEGGKKLAQVLKELISLAKPGANAFDLELKARQLIKEFGGRPSFLNYQPDFTSKPFPAALCVSINDSVVHGLPKKDIYFKENDLISLDIGMEYKGLYTDMAYSIFLGTPEKKIAKLLKAVRSALSQGIKKAKTGNFLSDISFIIEKTIKKYGFLPICELTGHGVGCAVHEEPYVFNCYFGKKNIKLKQGLVLALEPMAGLGSNKVFQDKDDVFKMADKKSSAHFEQTIVVTNKGPEIITPFIWEK